jgi:hypothetical protein
MRRENNYELWRCQVKCACGCVHYGRRGWFTPNKSTDSKYAFRRRRRKVLLKPSQVTAVQTTDPKARNCLCSSSLFSLSFSLSLSLSPSLSLSASHLSMSSRCLEVSVQFITVSVDRFARCPKSDINLEKFTNHLRLTHRQLRNSQHHHLGKNTQNIIQHIIQILLNGLSTNFLSRFLSAPCALFDKKTWAITQFPTASLEFYKHSYMIEKLRQKFTCI